MYFTTTATWQKIFVFLSSPFQTVVSYPSLGHWGVGLGVFSINFNLENSEKGTFFESIYREPNGNNFFIISTYHLVETNFDIRKNCSVVLT